MIKEVDDKSNADIQWFEQPSLSFFIYRACTQQTDSVDFHKLFVPIKRAVLFFASWKFIKSSEDYPYSFLDVQATDEIESMKLLTLISRY